jgi:glycosyltransferase involved in cell wall biosynthesis
MGWKASFVIPAHDEAATIAHLLEALTSPRSDGREYLIVVVCNACSDQTASIAQSFTGVTVLDEPYASKTRAMNDGDRVSGDVFPRFYVDADIAIDSASIDALVDAASRETALAVGPTVHFNENGAPLLVTWFGRAFSTIGFLRDWRARHLDGRGVYGASRAGRKRFGAFPELRSDDTFFDRMFLDHERTIVTDAHVAIPLPSSTRKLIRAQTRQVQAATVLESHAPRGGEGNTSFVSTIKRLRSLGSLFQWRHPSSVLYFATYATVECIARVRVAFFRRQGRTAPWR